MEETIFKLVEALNEIISDAISCNDVSLRARVFEQAKKLCNIAIGFSEMYGVQMPKEGEKAIVYLSNITKRFKPE